MGRHLAQSVQVVLVFDNARSFDKTYARLEKTGARLQKALRDHGAWASLKGYNTDTHLGLADDRTHVTIQRFDQQMALGGFADVLGNPLIVNGKTSLAQAIAQHQRALLIQVGSGSAPGFADAFLQAGMGNALKELGDASLPFVDDQAGYERRLVIAQTVGATLIKQMMPSAVHWGQSQQLFDGPTFANLGATGFSMPLYAGPFLYGGEELPDGSVKAGVRALGSQHLIGKMVMFKPDVQDWGRSYAQILCFISYCRSIGRILGDNEIFSPEGEDGPVLRVAHRNDIEQLPEGYVELSIDHQPAAERPPAREVVMASEDRVKAALRGTLNKMPKSAGKGRAARPGFLSRLFGRA